MLHIEAGLFLFSQLVSAVSPIVDRPDAAHILQNSPLAQVETWNQALFEAPMFDFKEQAKDTICVNYDRTVDQLAKDLDGKQAKLVVAPSPDFVYLTNTPWPTKIASEAGKIAGQQEEVISPDVFAGMIKNNIQKAAAFVVVGQPNIEKVGSYFSAAIPPEDVLSSSNTDFDKKGKGLFNYPKVGQVEAVYIIHSDQTISLCGSKNDENLGSVSVPTGQEKPFDAQMKNLNGEIFDVKDIGPEKYELNGANFLIVPQIREEKDSGKKMIFAIEVNSQRPLAVMRIDVQGDRSWAPIVENLPVVGAEYVGEIVKPLEVDQKTIFFVVGGGLVLGLVACWVLWRLSMKDEEQKPTEPAAPHRYNPSAPYGFPEDTLTVIQNLPRWSSSHTAASRSGQIRQGHSTPDVKGNTTGQYEKSALTKFLDWIWSKTTWG
jgi:hypothetical protein